MSNGTNVLVEWIQNLWDLLRDMGYYGIALGLMVEVIPSEIVLAYGGYLIWHGEINFWGAFLAGTVGGVLAQVFLYGLGYLGGRPLLEKYGRFLLILPKHLDAASQWFTSYGTMAVFAARFIPVVRHAISIPAGIARMPLPRFVILTTLAVIPWTLVFLYLGYKLGENWTQIRALIRPYLPYIIALTLILSTLWWIGRKRTKM